jgi:hypothetical protein
MPEFNVADASVATILKENSPLAIIKGYQPNTWFYVPRAPRIARLASDKPLFTVTRNRQHAPGGGGIDTLGGVFAAQLEISVPIPSVDDQAEWTELIRVTTGIKPDAGSNYFRFQPMRLRDGVMNILGVDAYVVDPTKVGNIPVGASATIPASLELNKLGADTFAAALKNGTNSLQFPLVASFTYKYDMITPSCHYELHANSKKVYDFFSSSVKARASWFGWVGANADIQTTRESLLSSGAITISEIARPDGFDQPRIKQLENTLIDVWTKNVLSKLCDKPSIDPAQAPNPEGFFGGVSVAIKSYSQVQNINLDMTFDLSELLETTHSMAYVFGYQFAALDPKDYLTDVIDDNRLPIVINLGKDERVHRYSGQYGYRKADGTFVANAITGIDGSVGGILTGQIQFAVNEQEPPTTEVQLSVDWQDANWEARAEVHKLNNGDSGALDEFSPGNNIARMTIISDLEKLPAGTISILNWKSDLPPVNGNPVKIYSGSLVLGGKDAAGQIQTLVAEFPYLKGAQAQSKLLIDVTVAPADGSAPLSKHLEAPITTSAVPVLRSVLSAPSPLRAMEHALFQMQTRQLVLR